MSESPATNSGVPERLETRGRWVPPADPLLALKGKEVSGPDEVNTSSEQREEAFTGGFEQAQQPVVGQQKPFKGDPYARMRVVEKEKRREKERADQLERQLNTLLEVVQEKVLAGGEEEEEEEPLNPIDALARKQDKILQKFDALEEVQREQAQLTEAQQIEQIANQNIKGFMEQANSVAPNLYQNAMAHLANAKMVEFIEDEGLSEEEATEKVAEWVAGVKSKSVARGENPGEALFKRSVTLGFDANGYVSKASNGSGKPAKQKQGTNPAHEIQEESKRRAALGSISSMSGTTAQDPLKGTSSLSEKDRVRTLMAVMKERGDLRRMRAPSLQELLVHKERR